MSQTGLLTYMLMNSIGLTILSDALRNASYCFTRSNTFITNSSASYLTNWKRIKRRQESETSLAFIQGTGLEIMLHFYHVNYDADEIRKAFFTQFNQRQYL